MSAVEDVLLERFLADSRACVESNRRLLSESRYRVAATRRRLNPAFGVSGGSPGNGVLRTTVRERLGSGSLFPLPRRVECWGGPSSGQVCVVCLKEIAKGLPEYVTNGGPGDGNVFAHVICYLVWKEESQVVSKTA